MQKSDIFCQKTLLTAENSTVKHKTRQLIPLQLGGGCGIKRQLRNLDHGIVMSCPVRAIGSYGMIGGGKKKHIVHFFVRVSIAYVVEMSILIFVFDELWQGFTAHLIYLYAVNETSAIL